MTPGPMLKIRSVAVLTHQVAPERIYFAENQNISFTPLSILFADNSFHIHKGEILNQA